MEPEVSTILPESFSDESTHVAAEIDDGRSVPELDGGGVASRHLIVIAETECPSIIQGNRDERGERGAGQDAGSLGWGRAEHAAERRSIGPVAT